jgi:NAD(P)-dependent dehydrogenase (short-subunit alcohol dehydrogenase family)
MEPSETGEMSTPLSGPALISGALGDIGRAIALALAARGADIALSDLLEPVAAAPLLAELRKLGRRARYDRVDVGDIPALQGWVAACERELGPARFCIPNAAVVKAASCRTIDVEEWRREIRVALDGAYFMAQAAALRMEAAKIAGRIVVVGSWAAERPHAHIPAYCAAKAGLRAAMRCLALEVAPLGILVNEVAPGWVDAGLSGKMMAEDPGKRERALGRVPIRSLISADEVARAVLALCDDTLPQCTGSVLTMDGGLSLLTGG